MTSLRLRLETIEADITTLTRDAIVNAANSALMPGGGVDGAIRRKAGHELDGHLYGIGRCPEGEAVITPGYRLPAKHVIHTVAPVWAGGEDRTTQEATLSRCYGNSLALADAYLIRSIAFPCIGTGIYGWPSDVAAKIAFDAVIAHLRRSTTQTLVTFCCFARSDRERYAGLIAGLEA
jgi:O-acetyl-ADP-ribose deacetylase (regulator of RNase III)